MKVTFHVSCSSKAESVSYYSQTRRSRTLLFNAHCQSYYNWESKRNQNINTQRHDGMSLDPLHSCAKVSKALAHTEVVLILGRNVRIPLS